MGWGHINSAYRYYYGPTYGYPYDWYYYRHMMYPSYYTTYPYDPYGECFTEYYYYEDSYYCYVGEYGTGDLWLIPLPAEYLIGIDPAYHYYYGPTYAYEYDWYYYRHLSYADYYTPYDYDPYGVCSTYYYWYDVSYYCFTGG
jgi:hypothetical protein